MSHNNTKKHLQYLLETLKYKVVNIDELLYYKTAEDYNFNLPADMRLTNKEFADLKEYFSAI